MENDIKMIADLALRESGHKCEICGDSVSKAIADFNVTGGCCLAFGELHPTNVTVGQIHKFCKKHERDSLYINKVGDGK